MSQHDPLHKMIPIKACPVQWDSMSGSDVTRTCTKCGALVFNPAGGSDVDFQSAVEKFKDRGQRRIFRRTDGKVMVTRCGIQPNWSQTPHILGWSAGMSALLAVAELVRFGALFYPQPLVWLVAFVPNLIAAFALSRPRVRNVWQLKLAAWAVGLAPITFVNLLWLLWTIMMYTTGPASE